MNDSILSTSGNPQPIVAVIGPSGCGKTAVGKELAGLIRAQFLDADDFHTAENKERMRAGQGLTDELRRPWLAKVHAAAEAASRQSPVVVACSALKRDYRQQLSQDYHHWTFVSLDVDEQTLLNRLTTRKGHFFPASLLKDQLITWQPLTSEEGFGVNGALAIHPLAELIRDRLQDQHALEAS